MSTVQFYVIPSFGVARLDSLYLFTIIVVVWLLCIVQSLPNQKQPASLPGVVFCLGARGDLNSSRDLHKVVC